MSINADITLVNLNLMYAVIAGKVDYQAYIPLGLLSIAANLEHHGYKSEIRDYQLFICQQPQSVFSLDRFEDFLLGSSDIIGFSCMSNLLPFALLAAKRIKTQAPNTTIIFGGVGPSGVPFEIMDEFPWIDFVCVGEGEHAIVNLMKMLRSGHHRNRPYRIPGILARGNNGKVIFSNPERITHLDSLPFPAYHLLDIDRYNAAFSILTSRGCPYKCSFCTETNHWGNTVVFRSIENVVAEIRIVKALSKTNVLLFQDDQITLNRCRAISLFQCIKEEFPDLKWKAFVRANLVDKELLKIMGDCGCIQVRFGIESGSNKVLAEIKKGFTIEEAHKSVRLALRYIPSVHASFIWGFPSETYEDFLQTLYWLKKFQQMGCTSLPFLLSPLPNSDIYMNYTGKLDFNENLQANFNNSGAENLNMSGSVIRSENKYIFDFIKMYPRVFPGFYLYDYENNIKIKKKHIYKNEKFVFRGYKKISEGSYNKVDL